MEETKSLCSVSTTKTCDPLWADPEREQGVRLENHTWLQVSLEILVRTPLEKQLGPIATRGSFVPYAHL